MSANELLQIMHFMPAFDLQHEALYYESSQLHGAMHPRGSFHVLSSRSCCEWPCPQGPCLLPCHGGQPQQQ